MAEALAELQTWMLEGIVAGAAPRAAVRARIEGDERLGPEGRFAIYAGGYRSRLVEKLRRQGIRDLAVLRAVGETPRG